MITFEEFLENYRPITNPFNPDPEEIRFETYGPEIEYIYKQEDRYIWTAVDTDNENTYILPGKRVVNRAYFFMCEEPWEDITIEVNDNEMISVEKAIEGCIDYFSSIGFTLDRHSVDSFFKEVCDKDTEMTIGDAKYSARDYWEGLDKELTDRQEDLLHDFYSNLI